MTEADAIEAMVRAMVKGFEPNDIDRIDRLKARAALRALLEGQYVLLRDQLEPADRSER